MNLVAIAKSVLGIKPSATSISNIAAESPLSRAIGTSGRISVPVGGGRRKGDAPLTDEERAELGFKDPKTGRVELDKMSHEERVEYNNAKISRQNRERDERAAKRKEKKILESMFGLGFRLKNDWQKWGNFPFTPQMAAAIITSQRLDVSETVSLLASNQIAYTKVVGLLTKHTEAGASKSRREALRHFMSNYDGESDPPVESPEAEEKRLLIRRAIKKTAGRRSEEARAILEKHVQQLIRATEREADTLEKSERKAHSEAGGIFGFGFKPSALLCALRQGHTYRLSEMLPKSASWHQSPRGMAKAFGLVIE